MATTDAYIKYDIRFFEEFGKYLGYPKSTLKTMQKAINDGLLQRERLVELAISRVSNIPLDSKKGMDLADGSDVKTSISLARRTHLDKANYMNSIKVTSLHAKVGDLRIVGYNKILDKFHYFYVPHDAYQGITRVEIVLEQFTDHSHQPEFTGNANRDRKWWNYEVDTFEDLCLAKKVT